MSNSDGRRLSSYLPRYPSTDTVAQDVPPRRWVVLGGAVNVLGAIGLAWGILRLGTSGSADPLGLRPPVQAGLAVLAGSWVVALNVIIMALWALALTRMLGGRIHFGTAIGCVLIALMPVALSAGVAGMTVPQTAVNNTLGAGVAGLALLATTYLLVRLLGRYGALPRARAIGAVIGWLSAPGAIAVLSFVISRAQ